MHSISATRSGAWPPGLFRALPAALAAVLALAAPCGAAQGAGALPDWLPWAGSGALLSATLTAGLCRLVRGPVRAHRRGARRPAPAPAETPPLPRGALQGPPEQLQQIIDFLPDATFVIDRQGRVLAWNRALEELTGVPKEDILGKGDYAYGSAFYGESRAVLIDLVLEPEHEIRSRYDYVRKEGDTLYTEVFAPLVYEGRGAHVWSLATALRDRAGNVTGAIQSLRDITDRKHAEEQLRHQAFHDALTGLPNRALLRDRLDQCLRRGKRRPDYRFAVAVLDLDRFKMINDGFGHQIGDQVLVRLAERLQRVLRGLDTVVRMGGDEFALLMEELSHRREALKVLERVAEALAAPLSVQGHEFFPSASIGVVLNPEHYDHADHVLRDADIAMYRAKALGGNRHKIFHPSMQERLLGALRLESDIRQGLRRDQFLLHYQPVMDLRNGRLAGVEALLRWQHPEQGLLLPGRFVDQAEESGLIVPLGLWALEQACAQLRAWQDARPGLDNVFVSVNLSQRQFQQPNLPLLVFEALQRTGLAPGNLKLEITESLLMDDHVRSLEVLEQLKALGVALAMDDFGTGYSSLSYLQRYPMDMLKIDRSFVIRMGPEGEGAEIVRTIVELAHTLGMEVTAEGVECDEQRQALAAMQCEFVQGYLFARPMPPQELEALLGRAEMAV